MPRTTGLKQEQRSPGELVVLVLRWSVMSDSAPPWTVAHQVYLSMEFSRQEYRNGLPFPTPRDLPDTGIESTSLVFPVLAHAGFTPAPPETPEGTFQGYHT